MTTAPTRNDQRALLRLLHGELPAAEAERLRARLAAEPELAAAHDRLAAVWRAAEPPPAAPPPPGYSGRVMARVRAAAREPRWSEAPAWVRATTAAAAVAGVVAGIGLGSILPAPAIETAAAGGASGAVGAEAAGSVAGSAAGGGATEGSAGGSAEAFDTDQLAALGLDGGLAGGYWEALGVIEPGEDGELAGDAEWEAGS